MADIRIRDLPTATPAVASDFVAIDNGTTRKVPISDLVNVGRPLASQAEAEAGTEPSKAMTPLTTKQSIAAERGVSVQAYSANLDTLAGIVPGAAGQAILADATNADVRDFLDAAPYVADRATLKALDTTKDTVAFFDGSQWKLTTGDFTSLVALDPAEALYMKADDTLASVAAWVRQNALKIDVRWCGAVVDGVLNSTGFTGTDDGLAIQRAMDLAVALFRPVYAPGGISIINNRGLLPTGRVHIEGEGSADSTWAFTGTFARTVQTHITHPDDGTDAPINIALKLVSAYSTVEKLALRLTYDGTNNADYGADIDVGIFVDSVPFCAFRDVRVTGYWRQAGMWQDITKDSLSATLDFLVIDNACWFQGKWGIRVEGPEPKIGNSEILPDDNRGAGGASNCTIGACRVWPFNHHSKVWASNTDGGCARVNGKLDPGTSAINAIQGRRWFGTKFQGAAPNMLQLDACIRETFVGSEIDRSTGYFKADGVTGVTTADCVYSSTSRTKEATFISFDVFRATNALTAGSYEWLIGRTEQLSNLANVLRGDLEIQANVTRFKLNELDGAVNAKIWNITGSGGSLIIQSLNDDGSFGANAITIARSGSSITSVTVNGPCVLNSSNVTVPNLPTTNPGGTRRLWVDTADSNRVKAT